MSKPAPTPKRINATSLSQYLRLENCERFLRFRLRPDEERALLKRWNLTIQPLTPLLRESGLEFEQNVAAQMTAQFTAQGIEVVDLSQQGLSATEEWLKRVRRPVILIQPTLEAPLGNYLCNGRADLLRLERDRRGALKLLIADIKASRHERTEHRLQIAVYAHLLGQMAAAQGITLAQTQGAVLHMQEDGALPTLAADLPTFDLDTYLRVLEHLVIAPDAVVNRVAALPFTEVAYHLSYKCDGCLYNALCMYDSAERLDLALTPYLTAVEKRVLRDAGVASLAQLAALLTFPELQPAPGQEALVARLANQWPVGPNLPTLVQRARRAMHAFDAAVSADNFIHNAGFGTLPADQDHPELVKVFFDAQHDYVQDRVYLIAGLVAGPEGEQIIVRRTAAPPPWKASATC